jgi:hypothetical protein
MRVTTAALLCCLGVMAFGAQSALAQKKGYGPFPLQCPDVPVLCGCDKDPSSCKGKTLNAMVVRRFKEDGTAKVLLEANGKRNPIDCKDVPGLC